jgi:hypothetical protein
LDPARFSEAEIAEFRATYQADGLTAFAEILKR